MQQSVSLKILFVINPVSGGKIKRDWPTVITQYFKELNHTIEFYFLNEKNDAILQQRIEQLKPHRVVAVGGDGTVSMVGKMLLGSRVILGILPAGSANGMAKELGIPMAIDEALDIVVNGTVKCLDVIQINEHICMHFSDIGMNALLIKYYEQGKIRGKLGYVKVAWKVIWRKQNMHLNMETKGEQIKRNAFMVILANARKTGFGAVINPNGNLYDGLFEVIVVRKFAISEFFKMWFRPQLFDPEKIEMFRGSSVRIETARKAHFQVDGEYLGKVKEVSATILPSQIHISLPEHPLL